MRVDSGKGVLELLGSLGSSALVLEPGVDRPWGPSSEEGTRQTVYAQGVSLETRERDSAGSCPDPGSKAHGSKHTTLVRVKKEGIFNLD